MRTIQQMISAEVCYCVSSLVSTLAAGYCAGIPGEPGDLADTIEQAFELACPVDDWEEAALQAGWAAVDLPEGPGLRNESLDRDWPDASDWRGACEDSDIEPYQREVFEHWVVSEWLADQLEAHGEKVDRDFAGLTVWARTTTGQAIYADSVIERIYAETHTA